MKKIISLVASVAMLASMFTSVSAATIEGNAPVVSTTIEEIDAATFEEFAYETLEEGQVAYLVTADFTGLDLSNVRGDSSDNKTKRTGVLMSAGSYEIAWDNEENIVGIYQEDRDAVDPAGIFDQTETSYCLFNQATVTKMYPTTKNTSAAAVEVSEIRANSFVVVTDGTPVTGTVEGIIVVREFLMSEQVGMKNFGKADCAYTVNGVSGNTVTLGTVAPPTPEEPNAVITKVELAEGVMGAAWDVTIENFDAAKSYTATFTAEDAKPEEAKPAIALTSLGTVAETDGDISFAVLLKLTKARAGLALGIEIK